jgi:hypothetical protein
MQPRDRAPAGRLPRTAEVGVNVSAPVPRVALRVPNEAAAALGVSPDFFDKHIRPDLKLIRRGSVVFVTVSELERWCRENQARTLDNAP